MKPTSNVTESVEKAHVHKPSEKQVVPQSRQQGSSWQFYFVVAVIAVGLIGLVGKSLGLF
jgi:hypothetical protein